MSAGWVRICRLDELEPDRPLGKVVGDTGQDRDRVCVVLRPEGPVTTTDRCPHRDVSVSRGIVRDGELVCPGHFWRFDLRTGARADEPHTRLPLHPTRVVEEWVEARLPDPEPPMSVRERLLAEAARRSDRPGPGR